MSSVSIAGDTSGSVLLQAPAVSGSTNIAITAGSGTLNVAAPAFSVNRSSNQSLSSGWNKIQFNTKEFDTANAFYNTTNYRFQPTVAGYYQISGSAGLSSPTSGEFLVSIYKNGSEYRRGTDTYTAISYTVSVSALTYLNGSTDYLELYAYCTPAGGILLGYAPQNWFTGIWVRGN